MSKTNDPPSIPQYDPDLFVNREEEIALVTSKAQELSRGHQVRNRTVVFWGYKGSGRTWLLRHLTGELSQMAGVRALYVDLERWHGQGAEQAFRRIMRHIGDELAAWLEPEATSSGFSDYSLEDQSTLLLADIRELLKQCVLVILLDHVYESSWDLLGILEERFLAQVAMQSRVLLVMAGRGRAYPWKKPELRLYVEDYHLQPFDQFLTEKQLEKQKPDAVGRTPEIYDMSQGYPLGNYLLADRPTVAEAMGETASYLLEEVPSEERSWLEALCPLRFFNEEHIPSLLAAYSEDPSILKWPYKEVRQARDRLLGTRLVRWKEKVGGWAVDEAIRPVLEKYLRETKSELWQRLHCTAYRLYKDWEQQYPEERERWIEEANYHAQCLREAGHDPNQCS